MNTEFCIRDKDNYIFFVPLRNLSFDMELNIFNALGLLWNEGYFDVDITVRIVLNKLINSPNSVSFRGKKE